MAERRKLTGLTGDIGVLSLVIALGVLALILLLGIVVAFLTGPAPQQVAAEGEIAVTVEPASAGITAQTGPLPRPRRGTP